MKEFKEKILIYHWILLIAGTIFPMFSYAQTGKHYTLNELIRSAYEKYPYTQQLTFLKEQDDESTKSVNAQWLPHASAAVKGSYQSEISSINIPKEIEDKFGLDLNNGEKLQYQGTLSVSQLIYDGGAGHIKKNINRLNNHAEICQVKSLMLQVEDGIDDLFEEILVTKEQIKAVQFKRADLELRGKDLSTAIQNGIALKTDIQEIEANIIQLRQQETDLQLSLCQKYVQLSSFVQIPLDSTAILDLPDTTNILDRNFSIRPDYEIFGLQLQNADWKAKELNAEFVPKLSLFANGYYGRPGLNMMNYSNHYSGIVGVSLTWNIDALYNHTHQKNLINIEKEITRNQQSIYEINLNRQIDNLNIDLTKNRELANEDNKIVRIRSDIKEMASIQLKNGTITLTDYLIKLNDEAQARINKSIHRIAYLMDGAKMKTLLNRNN